jgi:hypothetical protein
MDRTFGASLPISGWTLNPIGERRIRGQERVVDPASLNGQVTVAVGCQRARAAGGVQIAPPAHFAVLADDPSIIERVKSG